MSDAPVILPTPSHLTLLLKHGRSTTVLSVLPDTFLTTLKSQLLQVLTARALDSFPGTDVPLPTDPEDIELGVLVDKHEPEKGWVYAEDRSSLEAAAKGSKKKNNRGSVEKVADLELKDGGWIAYRIRGIKLPEKDDDDEEEEMEPIQDPGWNVELPSFEDDEGAGRGPFGGSDGYDGEGRYEDDDGDEDMDIPIPKPRNAVAR